MSLLTQVRSIARQAAKSGTGWKGKNGAIVCKDGRCTLAAIMFRQQEPIRKLQEEFDDLIARAEKYEKGDMRVAVAGYNLFEEFVEDVDSFVDPALAADVLGLDSELAELVARANDTSLKHLRREAEEWRQQVLADGDKLSDDDNYQEAKRAIRAREILEEELFS